MADGCQREVVEDVGACGARWCGVMLRRSQAATPQCRYLIQHSSIGTVPAPGARLGAFRGFRVPSKHGRRRRSLQASTTRNAYLT